MKSTSNVIYGLIVGCVKAFTILVMLAFILSELFYPEERTYIDTSYELYNDGWSRVMSDGTEVPIELPTQVEPEAGKDIITIKKTIVTFDDRDACLSFNTAKQDIYVYVDDKLRYSYSTDETRPFGKSSADIDCYIPLHPSDNGKTLKVVFEGNNNYTGVISSACIGSEIAITFKVLIKECADIIGAFILIFMGILSMCLGVFIRFAYKRRSSIGYLGLGVFMAGTWMLAESSFRQYMVPNFSSLSNMTYIAIMIMPMAFALYFDALQKGRYRIFYMLVCVLSIVESAISIMLQITGKEDLVSSLQYSFGLFVIEVVIYLITVIPDIIHGYVKAYIIEFFGILGGIFAGVYTIILYYQRPTKINGATLCIGFLFVVAMAYLRAFRDILHLERSVNAANQAQNASSEFLARMSHEMRTPINGILGMNKMILKESDDPNILEYARDVNAAGNYLLSIVDEVLDIHKVNQGTVEIENEEYELIEMIRECYGVVSPRAKASRLALSVEMDDVLPEKLSGDRDRLVQIIVTLLNNAIKFTTEGHVILGVTGKIQGGKLMLMISISDTGLGIEEEAIPYLFEPFQPAFDYGEETIKIRQTRLSVIKKLIEQMDGKIFVDSAIGKGTTISFILPQGICSTEPCGNFSLGPNGDRRALARDEKHTWQKRVLVVDDVSINLRVFSMLLKNTGIMVDTAKSGSEALEKIAETKYDLIFLDHLMPGMDGIEVKQEMERMENNLNHETPVIMQTANAVVGAREQYLGLGFADYIAKPIKEEVLLPMIKKYFD